MAQKSAQPDPASKPAKAAATGDAGSRSRRRGERIGDPIESAPAVETLRGPARVLGGQLHIRAGLPSILLTGLTLLLTCLIFPPVDWWPVGYVCLVPWLVVVCAAQRARRVYGLSYLLGLGFFLIHIRWMIPVTPPGYVAMCAYFALFFPLAAWPIRHMYRRRGLSAAITAPIAWTACEYLRSQTDLAFPWVLLGHSQHNVLTMIQISDLTGAYGVSFVLAMVNGWITDLLIQPILVWRDERPHAATRLPLGSLTTALVLAATVIYGVAQTSSAQFEAGPKVAVVQGDFGMYVDEGRSARTSTPLMFDTYIDMARRAAKEKPDLIVLPETAWSCYLNDEFVHATQDDLEKIRERRFGRWKSVELDHLRRYSKQTRDALQAICNESGIPILVGSLCVQWSGSAIPPRADAYNSALLLTPGRENPAARYDKRHLVLFGEYVPFRYSYHSIYKWLNGITPWGAGGAEYSLTPGEAFRAVEFDAVSRGRRYRAGTPICYEEVMPYVVRAFVTADGKAADRKNIDMLLSISNDGWFYHSAELEQHLIGGVFRAVEHRIAVARAVNTGASALIDPNGKVHHRVRLAAERVALLDGVEAALQKARLATQRAQAKMIGAPQPLRAAAEEMAALVQVLGTELPSTLRSLGTEFGYVQRRLESLWGDVMQSSAEQTPVEAMANVLDQIDDDLETVQRWRDHPDTAPGYGVGELRCDSRLTVYSRWGDWFALGALGLTGLVLVDWLVWRVRRRPKPAAA